MATLKRKAQIGEQCVACGCCEKVCPIRAVSIYKGLYAVVDKGRCVGCGKCANACPAAVITIVTEEGV